jgi:hypothetical protein
MVDYLAIRQFLQAKAEAGVIRLAAGPTYRALVLPNKWAASLAVLRQIDAFVAAGVPVIGPPPACPSSLLDLRDHAAEWKSLVAKLWSSSGPGRVQSIDSLDAVLSAAGAAPDFRFTSKETDVNVRYIHRTVDGADLYFLSNQTGKPVVIDADFRISGRAPELWDAVSGHIAAPTSFSVGNGRTVLPLALEATQSVFIVFRHPLPRQWAEEIRYGSDPAPNRVGIAAGTLIAPVTSTAECAVRYSDGSMQAAELPPSPSPVAVAGPWRVAFQPGRGAPDSITLDHL